MTHQMDLNEIITVTYKMEIRPGRIAEPWQPLSQSPESSTPSCISITLHDIL